MPDNSTSFVMTNIQEKRHKIKQTLGNLYGLRTWVEYSFRQSKQELGWTDYRFTDFQEINKWGEIVMSTYLMMSLNLQAFLALNSSKPANSPSSEVTINWASHPQWNHQTGWKNVLNNFRLIIQPTLLLWLIFPWADWSSSFRKIQLKTQSPHFPSRRPCLKSPRCVIIIDCV